METWFINSSTHSPPVKWNCFTRGGGIFGFAKNLENELSVNAADFTITYDPNGGEGSPVTQKVTSGKEYTTKPSSTFTRNGYELIGWGKHPTASDREVYSCDGVFLYRDSFDLTYYAIWEIIYSNLTYDGNGGTVYDSDYWYESYTCEDFIMFPECERPGYNFLGWKPTATSGGWNSNSLYIAYETMAGFYGDITLVAQWESQEYMLDVNGNLDGYYIKNTGVAVDLDGYATFDMYINGSRVATQVTDYHARQPYGTTYEIRNIQLSYDKEYLGAYYDNACTISGNLGGTMPANDQIVCLKIRTKTWNDYAASSYASGNGTASSPYIIKTPEQLAKLAVDSRSDALYGKHYKLGADIDLSAHVWEGIGNLEHEFTGSLNGDYNIIHNIKTSVDYYIVAYGGLIAYGSPTVTKVIMQGGLVRTMKDGAAIVGSMRSGSGLISNCIVNDLNISCTIPYSFSVGGIVGYNGREIANCIVKDVTLNGFYAGGIAGYSDSNIIDCCVLRTNIQDSANSGIVCGNYNGGVISSTYGYGYVNGISANKMYGSSSDFGNWTYNAALNDGYPVQKTLFHIGGISGSENVYNYLLNKLNLILDMDKYMAWENEQLAAHSKTQHFITKDANGVYAWSGESGGYSNNGTWTKFFYNPGTLVTGATYKLSYSARNTRTDSKGTTCIFVGGGSQYKEYHIDYVNTQEWKDYWCTFVVTDASTCNFNFGYSNGDLTYFKDIRLERIS